ncbi:MAG TPA: ABC transporter permease [Acidobacteriaceae bacterium]
MNPLRFFRRRRQDADLDREIAAHMEAERAENMARGFSGEEAERRARIKFGSERRVHEELWQQNSFAFLEGILRDFKYALRSLTKSSGFAVTVVLIMALGIGANTAVFSVMNAVLLKSLPVADPGRVFYLYIDGQPDGASNTGDSDSSFSWPVYDALRRQDHALSDVMAYVPLSNDGKVAVRFGNSAEVAEGDMVSGNFFSSLGVHIARGRGFSAQDEAQHAPVIVLSYNYWSRRFSRSPDVLGSTFYIKGVPLTVVGIAAEGFEGTEAGNSVDFWIPLQSRRELNAWGTPAVDGKTYLAQPNWWCLRLLARLAPGISQKQALAQTQTVLAQAAFIGINPRPGQKPPVLTLHPAKAFPGYEEQYGMPLKMMMAMVALVLLIALSNVAMLLIARNASRQREFSVRLSLGAGSMQLLRQLLAESAVLVAAAGALSWFFAGVGTHALAHWAQIDSSLAPDTTALSFTLAVLVLAALFFGLAPLHVSLAGGTGLALRSASAVLNRSAGNSRSARVVVALQMALCLTLLVAAGLLVRTLSNLQNTPLGFKSNGLVAFGINPQQARTVNESIAFYQRLLGSLRALPGVEAVSLSENRPGSGWSNNDGVPMIDGHKPPNSDGEQGLIRLNNVGPDFFHTLGIPILAGRDFADADTRHAAGVAIVNQTFAQRFLPNQDPVGHNIGKRDWTQHAQIVGVVKDHKYTGITEHTIPMLWMPYTHANTVGEMHVEMRVAGDALAILPVAQNAVRQIDPDLPLLQPMLQQEQFERSISQQILFARLAECFGLLAIALVATGIYGTLAYRVARRTAEIGVRMALGAQRSQVVWMVLRGSLWLTLIGLVAGAPLVILMSHYLASALYQVKPFDAITYVAAILGLALVALIASLLPALRAARLDPVQALRTE